MREWTTKDSGTRQEFDTGSVRDSRTGKGRFDLIPPFALYRIAGVYERGAVKYDDRNWEKGQPIMRYYDSAVRHLLQWQEGREDEDHLAQAAWNLLGMLFTEEMLERGLYPPSLNDKPNYQPLANISEHLNVVSEEAQAAFHLRQIAPEEGLATINFDGWASLLADLDAMSRDEVAEAEQLEFDQAIETPFAHFSRPILMEDMVIDQARNRHPRISELQREAQTPLRTARQIREERYAQRAHRDAGDETNHVG